MSESKVFGIPPLLPADLSLFSDSHRKPSLNPLNQCYRCTSNEIARYHPSSHGTYSARRFTEGRSWEADHPGRWCPASPQEFLANNATSGKPLKCASQVSSSAPCRLAVA